jgi:membrane fusion protein, multidrug efflux system
MSKILKFSFFIVLFAVVIGVKFIFFPSEQSPSGPMRSTGNTGPLKVDVMVLEEKMISNSIKLSGSVIANERVELTSEAPGKVIGIYFQEGSYIPSGTLLVKLNDADLIAQMDKTKINLELAKAKVKRQESLLELQATSQEEYDIVKNEVLNLNSEIEYLQTLIDKTEVRAPFSGIIGIRNIALGSYIGPTTIIATLLQTDPIKIEFSVPERYLSKIKKGASVKYQSEGVSGSQEATIQLINPQVELETRSVIVRATGKNTAKLFPGNFVQVDLDISTQDNVIQIPTSSVVPILKGQKVYIIHNGVASERIINTSDRDDRFVTVTEGLQSGDSLIVSAILLLKDGLPVMPSKAI